LQHRDGRGETNQKRRAQTSNLAVLAAIIANDGAGDECAKQTKGRIS